MLNRAVLFTVALLLAQSVAAQTEREPRSITVSGTASIRVVPDEVVISLSVESLNKDLRKAKADNDVRVQKVLAVTKEFQIEPRFVQTTEVSLAPQWDQSEKGREFLGYRALNQIRVTLRELGRYDEFVARAIDAGQALLDGVEFRSTQTIVKRAEARKMALQAAREKAEAMAGELAQKIGQPLSITEEAGTTWGGWGGYSNRNVLAQAGYSEEGAVPDVTTVALGQIEIMARVSVRFELQ
jgi:uncharacterized protein